MQLVPSDTPTFLSVAQFAELTSLSEAMAYRLVRTREIGSVRFGSQRAIRIPRVELERFMQRRWREGNEADTPAHRA